MESVSKALTVEEKIEKRRWKHYLIECQNKGRESCPAWNGTICIALTDTRFKGGICPFCRDGSTMTDMEKAEYKRIADYVRESKD